MKKSLWIVLGILAVLLLALPFLLSVAPGKWLVERVASQKLHSAVQIDALRLSWLGPQTARGVVLKSDELDGQVEEFSSPLRFWQLGELKSHFAVHGGALQVHAAGYPPGAVENIQATVDGARIEASGTTREANDTGAFSVHATVASEQDIELDATLTKMPSVLLDRYLEGRGKYSALLGGSFDAKGVAKVHGTSGTVDLDLNAPNGSASVAAAFNNNIITLQEPLLAAVRLTAESSQKLLGRVVESQDPITLRIEPEGFTASKSGALTIGHGTLDLARFVVRNVDRSSPLLSLLKRSPRSTSMSAWFGPVDFSLKRGMLELGRVDCLLDGAIHLCAWGTVDVARDRLDLMVGIPADTLASALGIQGLPANYVLKIPVQGTLEKPEANTGPAAGKIAALVAGQTALSQTPFGKVLGVFNAVTNDSSDVPPPKRPFPWER